MYGFEARVALWIIILIAKKNVISSSNEKSYHILFRKRQTC